MATRSKELSDLLRVPASELTVQIDEQSLGFASTSELIELLTGVPAGEADESGLYPEGSINARVVARLEAMGEMLRSPDLVGTRTRDETSKTTLEEDQSRERDPREGPGQPPVAPMP